MSAPAPMLSFPTGLSQVNGRKPRAGLDTGAGPPCCARVLDWNVEFIASLRNDACPARAEALCAVRVTLDAMARAWEVTIWDETWEPVVTLQGRHQPGDSAEKRARHEAILRHWHEIFAAAYGVPA